MPVVVQDFDFQGQIAALVATCLTRIPVELHEGYIPSAIVDRLNDILEKLIKNARKNLVIDSHLSHYLSNKLVDMCIVTKCELKELRRRLEKRGYHRSKIRENLDCEIFDVCFMEAVALGHKVKVIDTSSFRKRPRRK